MLVTITRAAVIHVALLAGIVAAGAPGDYDDGGYDRGLNGEYNGERVTPENGEADTVDTTLNDIDTATTPDTLTGAGQPDVDNGETWGEPRDEWNQQDEQGEWENGDQWGNGEEWGDETQPRTRDNGEAVDPYADDQNGADEMTLTRVREPRMRFGTAGGGAAGLSNLGTEDELAYNFYAGGVWEVNPFAQLKALGEATGTFEEKVLLSASLGANFFPVNAAISPYLGGDVGVGYGIGETDDGVGLELGASAGLLLFRLADTQVNLEAKTQWTLTEIDSDQFPFRYIGRLGILF
jgi:hypothetical protein